jgi:mycothiol synthase
MATILDRPFDPASDFDRVLNLLLACRRQDPADRCPPLGRLRMLLTSRLLESGRDARVWEDADGQIVGFAALFRHQSASAWASLVGFGAPAVAGPGFDAVVLAWALGRAREIAAVQHDLVLSWYDLDGSDAGRIALLERAGFVRSAVQTVHMARPVGKALSAPVVPDGLTLRPMPAPGVLADYRVAYAPIFGRRSLEHRQQLMREPDYDPALEFVLTRADGTLAGYCECSVERREWAAGRPRDGRIVWIATTPDLRRRGLGMALLLTALARLRAAGAETARLFTESSNAPARRLYAAHGFQVVAERCGYDLRVADVLRV